MKSKLLLLTLIICSCASFTMAQVPTISWQKTIGGTDNDSLCWIVPTADGGFIASGKSKSNISGNKTQNSFANTFDYWVAKLNSSGRVVWDKTLGGTSLDLDPVVIQTKDGGFLVGGRSKSDSTGATKTENAINESFDYWVIKLDKKGNYQWDNTIGGIQFESLAGLVQATDGGYLLAGIAHSGAGYDKSQENRGSNLWPDYWLVKLDRKGKVKWNFEFGGGNEDVLTCAIGTRDGGYILGGYSYSPAEYDKTDSFIGNCDYWIVKVDANGQRQWDKIYGSNLSDYQTSIAQTSDGGYILGGYSNSPAGFNKSGNFKGVTDYWIVKVDSLGNEQWDKTLGGSLGDYLTSIIQTSDKGYLAAGYSSSNISGSKSENSKGLEDIWLTKLDSTGKLVWDKTFGGSLSDKPANITELSTGEYILGAASNSPVSGDKTDATIGGSGLNDFWILRLTTAAAVAKQSTQTAQSITLNNSTPIVRKLFVNISPNPATDYALVSYTVTDDSKAYLTVYDNNGKVILRSSLSGSTGTQSINISKLAKGSYYFVVSSGKSSVTKTVVKE